MKEIPKLLSSKVLKVNGCMTVYEEYYEGHHPRGVDVDGLTGPESRVLRQVIKPTHVFTVFEPKEKQLY